MHIKFMTEKQVTPRCKLQSSNTRAVNFSTACANKTTMATVQQVMSKEITVKQVKTKWRENVENQKRRNKRDKQRDQPDKKYVELLMDPRIPRDTSSDIEMSSEASFTSSVPMTSVLHRLTQGIHNSETSKEMVDNVPIFDGKPGELNQFLSTVESFSKLYKTHKVIIIML